MLPEGMLDWFDVIKVEETDKTAFNHELDVLFPKELHIYLDERDNRTVNVSVLPPTALPKLLSFMIILLETVNWSYMFVAGVILMPTIAMSCFAHSL